MILDHNPFDIIANISLMNSIHNAEEFKEYELKINPAYTEYLALLCLTHTFDAFHYQNPEPIHSGYFEELQERLEKLFRSQTMYLAFKDVDPKKTDPPNKLDELRFLTLTNSLIVRFPSYHQHLLDILVDIFSPLEKEMEYTLGFNIHDAIKILEASEKINFDKL